jgi:hypothetical protein
LFDCPSDFAPDKGKCVKNVAVTPAVPTTPTPSPVLSRASTSSSDDDDEFEKGPVPFPYSGTAVVGTGLVALSHFAAPVNAIATATAFQGTCAIASWVTLGAYLPTAADNKEDDDDRRMLFSVDPDSGGEMVPSVAMILIIAGVSLHFICNIIFFITYIL